MRLTGTERVMDRLIGGAMEQALKIGLYPEAPGTHQVFVNTRADPDNPWRLPRPEAVIVAGLGEEGKLRASDLVQTVRQAVIAWAQRAAEGPAGAPARVRAGRDADRQRRHRHHGRAVGAARSRKACAKPTSGSPSPVGRA